MRNFEGHVLIIEDEPVIALELEILLGDLGFRSFDVADCHRMRWPARAPTARP